MRNILASMLFIACVPVLWAGTPVTPKISEVTIYRSGAKITSVATVKVPAGMSEVIFENLSPHFSSNSLQVKIKGDARLNAAVFQLKPPVPVPEEPRARAIRDSLTLLGDVLVANEQENKVLDDEIQMLQKNSARVGTTGSGQTGTLTVAQLQELADFYRQRLLEIRYRQQKLTLVQRGIKTVYERLQIELTRLQPNTGNQTGEITLKLDANGAQNLEIACTYLVGNASWSPLYDLRSAGLDKPLQLTYKANVRNNTGFDWKGVVLHLSSAQPLSNNDRPILNPVYVDFRAVAYYQDQKANAYGNVYQMDQIVAAPNLAVDMMRAGGTEPSLAEPEEADFLATFDLPTPQDILSDGKDNIVTLEEKDIPVVYEYHAVPKVEPAVFLLAKIADYGQYSLLTGPANIFFQETFVGQTLVNPQITADTLLLSLGRDDQLTIKRVQPKDFTERRKIFGSKIRETCQYEISIKNNKSKSVTVELIDQFPISKQKDIVVELVDRGGAKVNPEFGKLEWSVEVPAGQTKKVRFSYSVEYPKERGVGYFKG
ncbi:MAG: DUF4139 domain-containing protein [Lewinellaceae bacterium]|nr:DUF4139 domain-containing protein [Lewinellaceae bacterium]